ncbi:MAG: SIMPL domain-containing protein [Bacteroidales bacterium]|nr:SIMPL domain-containing protein [Bacteroidales bacterium]MDD4575152.1 SIMPL domain-containing protein [Bacteroidales bacterium]
MNIFKLLLTMVFFVISVFIFGQTNIQKTENLSYIEVIGTSEKEVIPDEIYLGIIIREKYLNKVKVSVEEEEEKLKLALKSLGIDLTNLYLTDINADFVKVRWYKKDVMMKKDYTLKVSDATTLGLVFQELDNIGIDDAFISKVSHSKLDSLKKEVRISAIKAAKDKAEYVLLAIGEQIGKPLIIKENEPSSVSNTSSYVRGSRSGGFVTYSDGVKSSDKKEDEMQFQKIKIETTMYVKFLIK